MCRLVVGGQADLEKSSLSSATPLRFFFLPLTPQSLTFLQIVDFDLLAGVASFRHDFLFQCIDVEANGLLILVADADRALVSFASTVSCSRAGPSSTRCFSTTTAAFALARVSAESIKIA
jgi:hypothetical protein